MDKPLLSIVVPTKDRYKYLRYLIEYVIELNNPQIEFVIQDNTANNKEIIEFLSDKLSENIKYFYTKESIPIGENSDKAVLNSTGKYVCYIGDDDCAGHLRPFHVPLPPLPKSLPERKGILHNAFRH